MIKAPYNFVPLNKKVFYPPWSDDISHDIPFEDGESGEISIEIEAKSPIFIRDSKNKEKFCNHNEQYYIPSTSIKGMVRNVLEIMSFSKLSTELFTDNTYSIRDLRNTQLYTSKMKPQNTFCGWLKKKGDKYIIEDCGIPGRIKQDDIDDTFAKKFKAHFNNNGEFINKPKFKTAKYKYEELKKLKIDIKGKFNYVKTAQQREIYKFGTQKEGTLVVTGQASARKDNGHKGDGKGLEFIFFDKKQELNVDKEVMENFLFAYFDGRKTEPKESPDWAYWKKILQKGGKVPVFFQKDDEQILHFGLSYLYKLPYNHSIKDGIYDTHINPNLDLAQTIFGYVNKSDKIALKGRVNFSHFKAIQNIQELPPRTENLGTPRASYYPNYLVQDGRIYSTYMDDNFIIAGRKRYPIHKDKPDESQISYDPRSKIGTSFRPLKDGIIFEGKIRYHNLKKAELGAILSTLTFHNSSNDLYHNIGLAKSLGYGKITIKIKNKNIVPYIQEFEKLMNKNISNWLNSKQLKELFTMSKEQNNSGNSALSYMPLTSFAQAKNNTEFLKYYSQLNNINIVQPNTLLTKQTKTQIQEKELHTISKTKMRKALLETWERLFNIFYHPNQIEEFVKEDFKITPKDQQKIYIEYKNNKQFKLLCKVIYDFNTNRLTDKEKIALYKYLFKFNIKA